MKDNGHVTCEVDAFDEHWTETDQGGPLFLSIDLLVTKNFQVPKALELIAMKFFDIPSNTNYVMGILYPYTKI